jgi:Mg2+ and Co2+ transporter CorA
MVKNSSKGGNRPIAEYQEDLSTAIAAMESECGIRVDDHVLSALGARNFSLTTKKEKSYTHPYPSLSGFGDYVYGCFSVPADIDDGLSDFTNLHFLATPTYLITIFHDPHWVYNSYFGDAVIKLLEKNDGLTDGDVSTTIVTLLGFVLSALDHSLEALYNRYDHYKSRVDGIDENDGRSLEDEVERKYPSIQSLSIEVESLQTVVEATAKIVERFGNGSVQINIANSPNDFFSASDRRTCGAMSVHAGQLVSFQRHLAFQTSQLLGQLDRYQEKALTLATHRITALGAFILIPNLLFDYFGQAFAPLPSWLRAYGFAATLVLTLSYWWLQYVWFRRKRYL